MIGYFLASALGRRWQGEPSCITRWSDGKRQESNRLVWMIIDITENAKLASTPRRYSYRNVICARIGVFLLALETCADSSDVEIGAERARLGLVRDLGPSSFGMLTILPTRCADGPSRQVMVHHFSCISILFEFLI